LRPRELKVTAVKSLSQALRRYTGLNHLAQAARAVLQNGSQISQVTKMSLRMAKSIYTVGQLFYPTLDFVLTNAFVAL
jgi:hypothetical protein